MFVYVASLPKKSVGRQHLDTNSFKSWNWGNRSKHIICYFLISILDSLKRKPDLVVDPEDLLLGLKVLLRW